MNLTSLVWFSFSSGISMRTLLRATMPTNSRETPTWKDKLKPMIIPFSMMTYGSKDQSAHGSTTQKFTLVSFYPPYSYPSTHHLFHSTHPFIHPLYSPSHWGRAVPEQTTSGRLCHTALWNTLHWSHLLQSYSGPTGQQSGPLEVPRQQHGRGGLSSRWLRCPI